MAAAQDSTPTTSRLTLRTLRDDDAGWMERLYQDTAVVSGFGERPYNGQRLHDTVRRYVHDYQRDGYRQFCVLLKTQNTPIGFVGIKPTTNPEMGELGYIYDPSAWGNGYATEAGRACVSWAFDTLPHLMGIFAEVLDGSASERVIEKLGFLPAHAGLRELHTDQSRAYEITRTTWLQLRSNSQDRPNGD